jgi:hypothetical protein
VFLRLWWSTVLFLGPSTISCWTRFFRKDLFVVQLIQVTNCSLALIMTVITKNSTSIAPEIIAHWLRDVCFIVWLLELFSRILFRMKPERWRGTATTNAVLPVCGKILDWHYQNSTSPEPWFLRSHAVAALVSGSISVYSETTSKFSFLARNNIHQQDLSEYLSEEW